MIHLLVYFVYIIVYIFVYTQSFIFLTLVWCIQSNKHHHQTFVQAFQDFSVTVFRCVELENVTIEWGHFHSLYEWTLSLAPLLAWEIPTKRETTHEQEWIWNTYMCNIIKNSEAWPWIWVSATCMWIRARVKRHKTLLLWISMRCCAEWEITVLQCSFEHQRSTKFWHDNAC